eukprot:CAMPEP_0176105172 /NCGR_PEP_ID=MMETSP0120_2-20121206/52775_1 /TAXON_ID=160619 /ORGANISM="Kryptoperidinium foliaceum, Strain CCMP 1326" /LENGTH=41 /DNA_ID= /DNA_START= /DNA_END= /DNA_ORIENTATION=
MLARRAFSGAPSMNVRGDTLANPAPRPGYADKPAENSQPVS